MNKIKLHCVLCFLFAAFPHPFVILAEPTRSSDQSILKVKISSEQQALDSMQQQILESYGVNLQTNQSKFVLWSEEGRIIRLVGKIKINGPSTMIVRDFFFPKNCEARPLYWLADDWYDLGVICPSLNGSSNDDAFVTEAKRLLKYFEPSCPELKVQINALGRLYQYREIRERLDIIEDACQALILVSGDGQIIEFGFLKKPIIMKEPEKTNKGVQK